MVNHDAESENPYLLLTPGPLSTSPTVRAKLLRDWCTWDDDYNLGVVTPIRRKLVSLATGFAEDDVDSSGYTSVLMQGSGSFAVEATIGTVVPRDGRLLVLANGAYGQRLAQIARVLEIDHVVCDAGELSPSDAQGLEKRLSEDSSITHVVVVHCETTTGLLNPLAEIADVVHDFGRRLIVDAMSSFGGVPFNAREADVDFLISSANKCIQGVPGFGFVVGRRESLEACEGQARSLSLDLYSQWKTMEEGQGKWRFTSPTHTVRAFAQALEELEEEGGVLARNARYRENHRILVEGMESHGFECVLGPELRSPIITAFRSPESLDYSFATFYEELKSRGFVIYPGKVSQVDSFRIGTIGHVFPEDFRRLIEAVGEAKTWRA